MNESVVLVRSFRSLNTSHKALAAATAAAGVFAFTAVHSPWGTTLRSLVPPCPFHLITGLWCPGCGSTRALYALSSGDIASAVELNPLFMGFLISLPVWLVMKVTGIGQSLFTSSNARWAIFSLVIAFFIARNIPIEPFAWLAP